MNTKTIFYCFAHACAPVLLWLVVQNNNFSKTKKSFQRQHQQQRQKRNVGISLIQCLSEKYELQWHARACVYVCVCVIFSHFQFFVVCFYFRSMRPSLSCSPFLSGQFRFEVRWEGARGNEREREVLPKSGGWKCVNFFCIKVHFVICFLAWHSSEILVCVKHIHITRMTHIVCCRCCCCCYYILYSTTLPWMWENFCWFH